MSLFRFSQFFSYCPFFLTIFLDPIQNATLHFAIMSHQTSLGCGSFSDFPCVRRPWQFEGVFIRYFVKCPRLFIFMIFLGVWEKKTICTSKIPFVPYHIKGRYYQHELSLSMLAVNYFKLLFKMLMCEFPLKMNGTPAKILPVGKYHYLFP